MYARPENDLIASVIDYAPEGLLPEIPVELRDKPLDELRVADGGVRHLSDYTRFWIDPEGRKHVAAFDQAWPVFEGEWNAPLVRDGNVWRGRVEADDKADRASGLIAFASRRRSEIEFEGMAWGEHVVATDAESMLKISAERLAVVTDDRQDGEPFFFLTGPAPLTNAQVSEIATAVRARSKSLIAKEIEVIGKILDGRITNTAQIETALRSAD